MRIITIILLSVFISCKSVNPIHKWPNRYGYYRQGGSLTIRLDSLGVIDSSTAIFVERIRRALNIDSNNIKYEIRNTQHR